ncbi:hypothetical protein [Streptococcus suis]|uniref:hypothetical protein n=1 Tax=Streptococcus suis TaxID=1307 RepID=UPI000CF65BF5|nr:hypothetical protein [Streptococcus suis]
MHKIKKIIKKNKIIYDLFLKLNNVLLLPKKRKMSKFLLENGELVSQKLDSIFDASPYTFFYASGSALGLYRDGKFINGDIDIDVGILMDEQFNWLEFEKFLVSNGLEKIKEFKTNNTITEQAYLLEGVNIDFFLYVNSNGKCQTQAYYRVPGVEYSSDKEFTSINLILPFELAVAKLETALGIKSLPEPIEPYLETLYTRDWRTPNPNWKDFDSPSFHIDTQLFGHLDD